MVRKAPRRVRIRNPLSGKHRAPQREVPVTCGFVVRGEVCSVDGGLRWGLGEGGRDGRADELEGAALDGGGFGEGRDDG